MTTRYTRFVRSTVMCACIFPFNSALCGPDISASGEFVLSTAIVEFRVKLLGFLSLRGEFSDITGSVVQTGVPETPEFNITVGVQSVDTRDEARDRFLRSAAFFDADQYPTIRLSKARLALHEEGTRQLVGDLTLYGQRRRVSFDVMPAAEGSGPWSYAVRATINRSEFGLDKFRMIASDRVEITVYVDNDVIALLDARDSACQVGCEDVVNQEIAQTDQSLLSPVR